MFDSVADVLRVVYLFYYDYMFVIYTYIFINGYSVIALRILGELNDEVGNGRSNQLDHPELRQQLDKHKKQRKEEKCVPLDRMQVMVDVVRLEQNCGTKHGHHGEPSNLDFVNWRSK